MLRRNVGQIHHDQAPKAIKNPEARFDKITVSFSLPACRARLRGDCDPAVNLFCVRRVLAAAVTIGIAGASTLTSLTAANATPVAHAAPAAPSPTSQARSPEAPDPHPPLGGRAPNGSVAGGDDLLQRGIIAPKGAPKLPRGIQAKAWILADLDSGDILAARDPHGRYQPASILKILTAITVMPNLPGTRQVTVSRTAAKTEGSAIGLLDGARYSVDQLFAALMMVSGNDAAMALAEANGGVRKTVEDMNAKAEELGAYDTFVETPSGLDGWQQLTSAYDMALILRAAVQNARLVAYDRALTYSYPLKKNGRGGVIPAFSFENQMTSFLTTIRGALLAKSGFTDAAQHTYIAAVKRHGRTLGVVLLRDQRWPVDTPLQADHLFTWAERLPSGTAPIGTLAGAIDQAAPVNGLSLPPAATAVPNSLPGQAAPLLSQAPDVHTAHLKADASGFHLSVGWLLGVLGICVATAATLRRQRRPQPPQPSTVRPRSPQAR